VNRVLPDKPSALFELALSLVRQLMGELPPKPYIATESECMELLDQIERLEQRRLFATSSLRDYQYQACQQSEAIRVHVIFASNNTARRHQLRNAEAGDFDAINRMDRMSEPKAKPFQNLIQ